MTIVSRTKNFDLRSTRERQNTASQGTPCPATPLAARGGEESAAFNSPAPRPPKGDSGHPYLVVHVTSDAGEELTAEIDLDDADLFFSREWVARRDGNTFYLVATRPVDGERRFHRVVSKARRGQIVDHIDRNGLNNRKRNLRFASIQQNTANKPKRRGTSRFKGVAHRHRKWSAQITISRRTHFLGSFDNEIDAAKAYDAAAVEAFGEFAALNFPGSSS